MTNELRNQTLVAAELAKQSGFEQTYQALMDLLRSRFESESDLSPFGNRKAAH